MSTKAATALVKRYYYQEAFAGNMEGYTADEVMEWTADRVEDFMFGRLTKDDVSEEW